MAKRRTPAEAEVAFRARVAELGGRFADGAAYRNSNAPVQLHCRAGHDCNPRPQSVLRGQGLCRTCGGNDPADAEAHLHRKGALG